MNISALLEKRWMARLAIILTIIFSISLIRNLWTASHQPDHTIQQSAEVDKLQNQVNQLQVAIEKEKDPFIQEKIIRDELNMQKNGEIIIQLPPLPTPTVQPQPSPTPTPQVYQQWIEVLSR
jgi:cell division protein FtsB